MESSISKEVAVTIEMTGEELETLHSMLKGWKREVGDRLPDGPSYEQNEVLTNIANIYHEASL